MSLLIRKNTFKYFQRIFRSVACVKLTVSSKCVQIFHCVKLELGCRLISSGCIPYCDSSIFSRRYECITDFLCGGYISRLTYHPTQEEYSRGICRNVE